MKERSFDEMIAYFNRRVSEMDIAQDYKMELLGMVTALGYKHEKTAQQWIPCSERLPEEEDYKSCIECLDGAVWYFTENGTMGIGYYYESTKEWSTTDDLKTDGKVVAWMPLPAPYKGGDKE